MYRFGGFSGVGRGMHHGFDANGMMDGARQGLCGEYMGMGHWWMGGIMMLIALVIITVLIIAIIRKKKRNNGGEVMETLNLLFVTGEIEEEEYLRRKKVLRLK